MAVFPDWQKHAVVQKRPQTGCIPTSYQMILSAVGATGVDFTTFQDEFDLDKAMTNTPVNNFGTVAAAVQAKYPLVEFKHKDFLNGKDKIAFIENEIGAGRPVMVSIWLGEFGSPNWHTMAVVDMDATTLTLLNGKRSDGTFDTKQMAKSEVARIHDSYAGGKDVAWLAKWN